MTSVGERYAHAVAGGDRGALLDVLAADVQFRAVTPGGRVWEADSSGAAVDVILGTWFGGERHIDAVERVDTDTVGGCERVGYRFRATTPGGPAVVEQQAYLDLDGDTITAMRITCTGFHAVR